MPRVPYTPPLGERLLLALTCSACGELLPPTSFEWRPRLPGGKPYIDRRCRKCRWLAMEGRRDMSYMDYDEARRREIFEDEDRDFPDDERWDDDDDEGEDDEGPSEPAVDWGAHQD